MNNVVTIRGLDHRYGATHALRGVDLTVAAGECVALLGPNGAGKTTLVGALTGMLAPSAGIARIDGADPRRPATRRRLGVVHQQAGFPRTLKVRELVSGWAVRAGRPASDADAVLTEVSLHDLTKRRVTALSGGQQQRLQLAMALVVDPTLLVLDEPTVGLDIDARRRFWATLAARRDRGTAVLLTTHQIEEAAAVADRVVVLHEGTVIASGHPADLTAHCPTAPSRHGRHCVTASCGRCPTCSTSPSPTAGCAPRAPGPKPPSKPCLPLTRRSATSVWRAPRSSRPSSP